MTLHILSTTDPQQLSQRACHAEQDDAVPAEQAYRAFLEQQPCHVEALYRLALLMQHHQRHDEALPLLDRALERQPRNPLLHAARAEALAAMGMLLEGLEGMADAADLMPARADLLYSLGLMCAALCCPAMTEAIGRRLLRDRPDWPQAHYLMIRALTGLEAGLPAMEGEPDLPGNSDPLGAAVRFARGEQQLRDGNYRDGWNAQEGLWEIEPAKSALKALSQPRWEGGPLSGRRLLILGGQRCGDILQFSRYLPLLQARGASVAVHLNNGHADLARLLRHYQGVEVTVDPQRPQPHDFWSPLASLPRLFLTRPDNVPAPARPALHGPDMEAWVSRLLPLPRPWIGICWDGSAERGQDSRCSLPLGLHGTARLRRRNDRLAAVASRLAHNWDVATLEEAAARDAVAAEPSLEATLTRCPGSLIALQADPGSAGIADLPPALAARVVTPLDTSCDFYDTACLIASLDAVLTVDAPIAHLAGTLGRPVTLIHPAWAEWRWMQRDGSAVWYPCMRVVAREQLGADPAGVASGIAVSASANCRTSAEQLYPKDSATFPDPESS